MIRLSVMYPATEDAAFDHDYYRNQHIPLVMKTWGLEGEAEIDRGINGPYIAAVHLTFESVEAMQAAMSREGSGAVAADMANYTTITPVVQTSEIVS